MPSLKTVQIGTVLYKLPFADLVPMDPEDREALRVSIVAAGKVREPIVTWKEQSRFGEETVVDGANRVMICAEENLPNPPRRPQSFASEEEARKECEDLNYARRHLTREQVRAKRAARVERVAAARVEGQSLRAIAEEEGVSTTQVREDIKAATVQGCTVEPPDGQVVGKDKKKRAASNPVKCANCKAKGLNIPDCPACAKARAAKKKPRSTAQGCAVEPPDEEPAVDLTLDGLGNEVPEDRIETFAVRVLVKQAASLARKLDKLYDQIAKHAGGVHFRPTLKRTEKDGKERFQCSLLEKSVAGLKLNTPHSSICPRCERLHPGETDPDCPLCKGDGWLTRSGLKFAEKPHVEALEEKAQEGKKARSA